MKMILIKYIRLQIGLLNAFLILRSINSESCARTSTCACECSQGVIDFSALSTEVGPKYKDRDSVIPSAYKYSYNPCIPFTETAEGAFVNDCQNVAACQFIPGTYPQFYDTGKQDSVTFYTEVGKNVGFPDVDGDVLIAKYVSNDKARQTEVILVCNDESSDTEFEVMGEIVTNPPTYRFILVSPEGCFKSAGLSAGSILLIIFFSALAAYILVGIIVKKFVYKASGTDLIPHAAFWFSLPQLVKTGCLCVVNRQKLKKQEYGSI